MPQAGHKENCDVSLLQILHDPQIRSGSVQGSQMQPLRNWNSRHIPSELEVPTEPPLLTHRIEKAGQWCSLQSCCWPKNSSSPKIWNACQILLFPLCFFSCLGLLVQRGATSCWQSCWSYLCVHASFTCHFPACLESFAFVSPREV